MPTAAPDAVALTAMIASLPLMLTRRPPISYAYERFTSKNFLVGTSPTQYGNLLLLGTPNQTDAVNMLLRHGALPVLTEADFVGISASNRDPHGLCVTVVLPMAKGEGIAA